MALNRYLIFIFCFQFHLFGQDTITDSLNISTDSLNTTSNKTGFAFGGTPILAFDADLGLKYGVVLNLFDYGDVFPNYLQYAKLKIFKTTNGTSNLSLIYDNNKLFKKSKFIFESTYTKDIILNFYGFNGVKSIQNSNFKNPMSSEYLNPFFYTQQRQLLRFRLDFHKELYSEKLRLLAGVTFNSFKIDKTDLSKFDIPLSNSSMTYKNTTLYEKYVDLGLISQEEKHGGTLSHLKLGVTYDTRNNIINCTNGINIETYIITSPKLFNSEGFTKHIFTFKQYYHIKKIKTLFTYRLSSQQKISGTIPFYYLPTFHDTQINTDGLGGAFNLRGIFRNRIVGNGFVTGNFEVRKNILSFKALKQHCKIQLSCFTDLAYLTQEYSTNLNSVPQEDFMDLFKTSNQKVSYTYGVGLYLIYSSNNIVSINYGFSPNKMLGTSGLYVGSSFLF